MKLVMITSIRMRLIGILLKIGFLIMLLACSRSVRASPRSLTSIHSRSHLHHESESAVSFHSIADNLLHPARSGSNTLTTDTPSANVAANRSTSSISSTAGPSDNPQDASSLNQRLQNQRATTTSRYANSNNLDDTSTKATLEVSVAQPNIENLTDSIENLDFVYSNHVQHNDSGDDIDVALRGKTYDEQVAIYYRMIYEHIQPTAWKWVLIVCNILVFVVGLMGNALVCAAVFRNYAMRTVTNYFIVNLAVADFLVILFCLPPTLLWDVTSTWFFGDLMCKTVLYLQTVSVTVSVLTLTFISIDRWYAICYPLRFKSTTRRAQTAICVIWLVSLCLDIPELIANETTRYPHRLNIDSVFFTQCVPAWSALVERNNQIFRIVLLYFLPLVLMSIFYVQIIRVLWNSGTLTHNGIAGRHINFSMVSNASIKGQLRSRKKAAKMLVCVVGMFAFCYFPVYLMSLTRIWVRLNNGDFNNALAMISHWLCYANSALNPVIYNFMSDKFKKEFKRTIYCTAGKKDAQVELNNVLRTQLRKALSSSLARSETNRTYVTTTT